MLFAEFLQLFRHLLNLLNSASSVSQPLPWGACSGDQSPSSEEPFLSSQIQLPMSQIHAILSGSITVSRKRRSAHLLCFPCEEAEGHHEISFKSSLLWAEQTKRLQLLSIYLPFQTFHHLGSPPQDILTVFCPFVLCTHKVRLHQCCIGWINHLPWLAGNAARDASWDIFGFPGCLGILLTY